MSLQSLIYVGIEKGGQSIVQLAASVILMRILSNEDFGLAGLALAGIGVFRIAIEAGLGSSLIQAKEVGELDYNTVFLYNITVAFVGSLILFFLAPAMATFYELPELKWMIRFATLILIVSSLVLTQRVQLQRALKFQVLSRISLISVTLAGATAIGLAYYTHSPYAIISQPLVFSFLVFVQVAWQVKFIPSLNVSKERLGYHFNYSTKLLGASLSQSAFLEFSTLILGSQFSVGQVGIFAQSRKIAAFVESTFRGVVDSAVFSHLSRVTGQAFKEQFLGFFKQLFFMVLPVSIIASLTNKPLVNLLYGDEWIAAAWLIGLFVAILPFLLFDFMLRNELKAKGDADLLLKIDLSKRAVGIIFISILSFYSFEVFALGYAAILSAFGIHSLLYLITSRGYNSTEILKPLIPITAVWTAVLILLLFIKPLITEPLCYLPIAIGIPLIVLGITWRMMPKQS